MLTADAGAEEEDLILGISRWGSAENESAKAAGRSSSFFFHFKQHERPVEYMTTYM